MGEEETGLRIKDLVNQGVARKYRSVRLNSPWYDSLPTIDTLGCQLSCCMCWLYKSREAVWVRSHGKFYSPQEVSKILKPYRRARISGGEPLLNLEHMYLLAQLIPKTQLLVETTGIDLDEAWVKNFSALSNVYFRVGLKGVDEKSSEVTSGHNIFWRQIKTVELLSQYGIPFHCALIGVYTPSWVAELEAKILAVSPQFCKSTSRTTRAGLEIERLSIYPYNRERVQRWLEELGRRRYYRACGTFTYSLR